MLDLHVPSIAGSNQVGVVSESARIIPEHERCPMCKGTSFRAGLSANLSPAFCLACHGTGKKS